MKDIQCYEIAGRRFSVNGEPLVRSVREIPGFDRFLTAGEGAASFRIVHAFIGVPSDVQALYRFDEGGILSVFSSWEGGHHLSMVRKEDGRRLDMWSVAGEHQVFISGDLSARLLRFALWLAYGLMTVDDYRIAVHGSCIVWDGGAYLFLGESGTGKSTHTRLWREHIPGSFLLNDDSPVVAVEDDGIWVYGSPWSGKTPCYRRERYPLRAFVRLSQASGNRMERLDVFHALAALHPSCPPEFAYDRSLYGGIAKTLDRLIAGVRVFHLACLPDRAAAILSHRWLTS